MRLKRTHNQARPELLPLMDVIFLVLLFLVYALMTMVAQTGMPVNLPTAANAQPDQMPAIAITIQADGSIWLDKQKTDMQLLPQAIRRISANSAISPQQEPIIQVLADAALPYQKLFDVLEALKQAGINKISLQARVE